MSDEVKDSAAMKWPSQEETYREIWLRATPAERLRKLEELIAFARRQTPATERREEAANSDES